MSLDRAGGSSPISKTAHAGTSAKRVRHLRKDHLDTASISDSDAGRLLEGKNAPAVAALMWDCGCSCQLLADQLQAEWAAAWRSRPANIGVQRLCP